MNINTELFAKVDNYISNLLAKEDTVLTETLQAIRDAGLPPHSISANQGKFLQVMMMLCNAGRVLELGTLGGYSTIWLARALPEGGKIVSIESDKHHAEVAMENIRRAGLSEKVHVRIGNALDVLPRIIKEKEEPFDMIFIDADKPPYPEYFQLALKLSRPGTLLIFDNVLREGKVLDDNSTDEKVQGVCRLNKILSESKQVTATILHTVGIKEYDGMAIAIVNRIQ